MATDDTTTTPASPRTRRWPRRVAIGAAAVGVLLAGAYWYLGRETTLQMLAQRIANASGGHIVISGVTGSLYGAMHMERVVFRNPDRVITGDRVDIDWSPWQYLSSGVAISKLHVADVKVETLRETEPAKMPASIAPPFTLSIADARLARLTMTKAGAGTVINDVRFKLSGDKQKWELKDGGALTPWGLAAASGTIESARPFRLSAAASLTQTGPKAGQAPAQLALRAHGDLANTLLDINGKAGKAAGDARLTLAPFEPVPLRDMNLNARNIDPGFFNPALPNADLSLAVTAKVEPNRNLAGSVDIANGSTVGPIDSDLLPLRAMRGRLAGSLSAMRIDDVLLDLGDAGRFSGSGTVQRAPREKGPAAPSSGCIPTAST